MRKVVLPLALLSSIFADGSAHAQCAATDKIYIDPRLVPKPLPFSQQDLQGVLLNRHLSPEAKNFFLEQAYKNTQPIAVPFGTGKVLVSPTNPCIQQYIP